MDRERDKIEKAKRLFREGDASAAERLLKKIIEKAPAHAEALYFLGVMLLRMAKFEEAARYLTRAARLQPAKPEIHNTLGVALFAADRNEEAIGSWTRAIDLAPAMIDALVNRARANGARGNLEKAAADLELAIERDPGVVGFHLALAETYVASGALERALTVLDAALSIDARSADGHCIRGNVLSDLGRIEEALNAYDAAIGLEPTVAGFHLNKAHALVALGRGDDALCSYDQAIALEPGVSDAYVGKAEILTRLNRLEESFALFNRALAIDPNKEDALAGRAANLLEAGFLIEALRDYETLAAIRGDENHLIELRGFIRRQMCDWSLVQDELRRIEENIRRGAGVSNAFPILSVSDAEEVNLGAAKLMTSRQVGSLGATMAPPAPPSRGKITLGYFSADFHDHATMHLLTRVLELADRNAFELIGFSFGPDIQDAYRARVAATFDAFLDVSALSDEAVARRARERFVDVAIDLKGLTKGHRIGIFARRAAPIQVNFLGYPGSMGADFIDYIVADRTVVTARNRPFLLEKTIYLPDCYQPNDPEKIISDRHFGRREVGLPEDAFVYCCFSNPYKILPEVFDAWMRILRRVPQSVIWLIADNDRASDNLRREAENRRVEATRLIFSPRLPLVEHLARHRLADLFLDTLPYNAHTTASDALFVNVPVLTCAGQTFAGRVGASLLTAAGLPELVAPDLSSYEEIAVQLATKPERLESVKRRLREKGAGSALFDARRYAANLEKAFIEIHRRRQEGLPPDDIYI